MVALETRETNQVDLAEKLDQSCQIQSSDDTTISKASSKKKKNKKKSQAVESLNPFYQESMKQYPVKVNITRTKGRHAIASENLKEGEELLIEKATSFVVRSEFIDQQCHICLNDLDAQKIKCSDCNLSFYCSQSCKDKDYLHPSVCYPFTQLYAIGRATDVDPDLLRLMTILIARKHTDCTGESAHDKSTPFWCVNDLVSHRDSCSPDFIKVVTDASQRLSMEMSDTIRIPVDDMVTLACRINSNAHGLGDNQSRNTDVALGLFPLAALFFNHSCNPNCMFVGLPDGKLSMRTIRPVSKDEELVVTYIDLYSDRDERRQELFETKHFWCKCKRCASPIEKSVDRFLQGVLCDRCDEDVYVIPPTSMENLVKGQRNLYTSTVPFKCASCGDESSPDAVRQHLEDANKIYSLGMTAIRQKRDYKRGAEKLELLTKSESSHGGELHILNSYRFNSYIPLMNCKRHSGDMKGAIEVNKFILIMLEQYSEIGLLPGNTSEISDFWQNLGELCDKMATESRGRSHVLEKKWLKEARTAFVRALKMRTIVFGKNHPKTKFVEKFVTTLTSSL
ncbi:uncharacterized protein EV154DRAFT_507132 [Mucor mucedo]|uniref:uncharacterized protein n=1 Tax=Mucor mucedo TaxID=29922 RepID=UPI00221F5416|nr:uncharacterized protein EV154DRAFT_507132 [Mucor mucedo]KAI7891755.1 hypothetical protein EV154DRAFT_507132 [Mucor mucedo]